MNFTPPEIYWYARWRELVKLMQAGRVDSESYGHAACLAQKEYLCYTACRTARPA